MASYDKREQSAITPYLLWEWKDIKPITSFTAGSSHMMKTLTFQGCTIAKGVLQVTGSESGEDPYLLFSLSITVDEDNEDIQFDMFEVELITGTNITTKTFGGGSGVVMLGRRLSSGPNLMIRLKFNQYSLSLRTKQRLVQNHNYRDA